VPPGGVESMRMYRLRRCALHARHAGCSARNADATAASA
jgi:hypothetical protein